MLDTADKKLDQIHRETLSFVHHQLQNLEPQMVASTMLAIAMRIYKTILTPDDFEKFMLVISNESNTIESFNGPTIN